ncbi:MAG: hypothetical protein M1822_010249 [Bathelium mastoideum]|nr:MAG: hypothetical protein M1822_010249 [Bathelium mastoideum]
MSSLYNNDGIEVLSVPGFGLDIDFELDEDDPNRLQHGIDDCHSQRMTIREVAMLQFMDAITDKPNWDTKIFDDNILTKWRDEAGAQLNGLISTKAFDWCVTELEDNAATFQKNQFVKTLESGTRCVKSDTIIPSALRNELRRAVQPLLAVSDRAKDWHPNSNEQVLNLVHPSLYPLVYGMSRVLQTGKTRLGNYLETCGKGQVAEGGQEVPSIRVGHQHQNAPTNQLWSTRFQWLPCEVKFKEDTGTDVRITSYINNLRPDTNKNLYHVIEKFISKAIPLWNLVLMSSQNYNGLVPLRLNVDRAYCDPAEEPSWLREIHSDPTSEELSLIKDYMAQPDNPDYKEDFDIEGPPDDWEDEIDGEWSPGRIIEWKYKRTRKVLHPDPDTKAYPGWRQRCSETELALEEKFRKKGLQVIVKLSSIELSPDKPTYPGGSWHLEGMLNEHIVATAIYYYDVENVTPSRLQFRQNASLDEGGLEYEQDDHWPLSTVFGTNGMRDEPAIQVISSVATTANRFLVFPNTRQHKVEAFELADSTKPGHRRFLVLWLVDPHYRICSTANVPPQQPEWIEDAARRTGFGEKLPPEVMNMVMSHATEDLISLDEAKKLRLELMQERSSYQDAVDETYETYNLCEH